MVALNNNIWALRGNDGQRRSHVPALPVWVGFLRVAQLLVALLIVILTGVAATGFRTSDVSSPTSGE